MTVFELGMRVKKASVILSVTDSEERNKALLRIAEALEKNISEITEVNKRDLENSIKEKVSQALIKRLEYSEKKIRDSIEGLKSLAKLDDPIGKTLLSIKMDEGLDLYRVTCPIGVIGVIFESRPDALVQISALCLKSGNGVLLKGGSEAKETNRVLFKIIMEAVANKNNGAAISDPAIPDAAVPETAIPANWAGLLEDRSDVLEMLKMDGLIDLIIPRGSNEFVRYIMENTKIPVMGHADGICHCYIDETADPGMALKIAIDSKTQYTAVCNAAETLLVNKKIAADFLPAFKREMDKREVVLYGCPETRRIIETEPATDDSWKTEYLDCKMSVKVVQDMKEAIDHINTYGSGHTDCIVADDREKAAGFLSGVDSANVFWNCSTRFSDGYRYGFGAEVGISTGKLHARGPVGLEGLVTYKYKLLGNGHIVDDYAKHRREFKHIKTDKECPL